MIIAAATPDYIPGISYFARMAQADRFILADDIQYSAGSRVNRTLIRNGRGTQWLTVPIRKTGKGRQCIQDIKIDPTRHWQKTHWRTIYVNYKYAPYFEHYVDFFEHLYRKEWVFLMDVNLAIIRFIREALGISGRICRSSEYKVKPGATERILDLARQLKCETYLAAQADNEFLNEALFPKAGITLTYFKYNSPQYRQQFAGFIPNLSMIDLLFNQGPEAKRLLG